MSSSPLVDGRQPRVLVVDDEPPIVELVTGYLEREGWAVKTAGDGLEALEAIESWGPDAVILDLMLPGVDGIEVCRRVRAFSDAYVLMLTARSEEIDRIVGLTVGADDYMAKPFSPRELVARMKALLRRPRVAASGVDGEPVAGTMPHGIDVDEARRSVKVDGQPVELTVLEFNLLAVLARSPGIVVSRQGSSTGCGASTTSPITTLSTCTWPTCAASSATIRDHPASSRPCAAWATGCARLADTPLLTRS